MPRNYGKVSPAIFTDEHSSSWTDVAFRVAVYLLAGPHASILGCFRLPIGYVEEDLRNRSATVGEPFRNRSATVQKAIRNRSAAIREAFEGLIDSGFIRYCERTQWVWVRNFLQHNPFENPNAAKAALRFGESIPTDASFYAEFADYTITYGRWKFDKADFSKSADELFRNRSATVPQPLANPSGTRGRAREPEPEPTHASAREPEPEHEPQPSESASADSCAEPRGDAAPFIELPVVGGANAALITEQQVVGWEASYPGIDVRQQLRHMREWLAHNPSKRKTPRGIGRFIVNWLARAQDKPTQASGGRRATDNSQVAENLIRRIQNDEL